MSDRKKIIPAFKKHAQLRQTSAEQNNNLTLTSAALNHLKVFSEPRSARPSGSHTPPPSSTDLPAMLSAAEAEREEGADLSFGGRMEGGRERVSSYVHGPSGMICDQQSAEEGELPLCAI